MTETVTETVEKGDEVDLVEEEVVVLEAEEEEEILAEGTAWKENSLEIDWGNQDGTWAHFSHSEKISILHIKMCWTGTVISNNFKKSIIMKYL